MRNSLLDTSLEYLKGVGPAKFKLLSDELHIYTFGQFLQHYPLRYVDRSKIYSISEIHPKFGPVQLKGTLSGIRETGPPRKRRLHAKLTDETGSVELVWFKGANWIKNNLIIGGEYLVYGNPSLFQRQINIAHPEMELIRQGTLSKRKSIAPVYPSTEKLSKKGLDSRGLRKLMSNLFEKLNTYKFKEFLPGEIIQQWQLMSRDQALREIHFPHSQQSRLRAETRLKFEELFLYQFKILYRKNQNKTLIHGAVFKKIGTHFNRFFHEKLPFELTNAQKRVIREIRQDLKSGKQMNRLLQGDVGSGKTIVALMCVLIAVDNGYQACLLAPTEILAQQHYNSIEQYVKGIGVQIAFLSGSVKGKKRKALFHHLSEGHIDLLIGTHAILEDPVIFNNLGLAITDEQHRFGVKQRAKLWQKNPNQPPHILVMTATPIPRTLAMTTYGDLDISVIDELPPGRKKIETLHWFEKRRLQLFGFLENEINKGRQAYIVYPMIEESETMDLANLQQGYEAMQRVFAGKNIRVGVVHGKMKPEDKDFEMQRFARNETQVLVATTVIEVGVNVPNATVMVIENAERFGLSQLHQLRGRVGRGGDQSYCILMTSYKLSNEGKKRMKIMVDTNDGFKIAQADLEIRGPGDIEGTQQSGIAHLKLSNIVTDGKILRAARTAATRLIESDSELSKTEHQALKKELTTGISKIDWKDIS